MILVESKEPVGIGTFMRLHPECFVLTQQYGKPGSTDAIWTDLRMLNSTAKRTGAIDTEGG